MKKGQIKQKQDNITYIVYMHIAPSNKKIYRNYKRKKTKRKMEKR